MSLELACPGPRPPRTFARRFIAQSCSLAGHLATAAAMVGLTTATVRQQRQQTASAAVPDRTIAVFVTPREASTVPGLNPIDLTRSAEIAWHGSDTEIAIPGFQFDMRRIAERATLLFPFLTPGVSLDAFGLASRRGLRKTLRDPLAHREAERAATQNQALVLSDLEIQKIVDDAWSRRDRWTSFQRIARLMDAASADQGQLPAVLHAYVEQNALQPFLDTTIPDPRLWAELGIAADHVRFIAFISDYASRHASTKATTELLLLLDTLVQASADAFSTLMSTDIDKDLRWTHGTNPEAYRLIGELQRFYRAQLEARGLTKGDRLRRYYDGVRLRILTAVLQTTPNGYRSGDARFLAGEILWRQGDAATALDAWRGIEDDPADIHVYSYRALLAALNDRTRMRDGRINDILRRDRARWLMSSMDRLHQFGYRIDTY